MGENFSLNGVNQNWLEKKDYYSKIKDVVEQEGLLDDGELTADEIKEYFSPEKAETDEAKKANAQLISDFLNEFEMSDEEYFEFVGNVESETEEFIPSILRKTAFARATISRGEKGFTI